MRIPKQWILGAAVAAALGATPTAQAGPFDIFRGQSAEEVAPSNTQTAKAVAAALKGAGLTGRDIQIEVQNGTAVLKGQIADAAQKATATKLVAAVPGVRSVDNRMAPMKAAKAASPIVQAGYTGGEDSQIRQVGHEAALVPPAPGESARPAGPSNQQVAQQIAGRLQNAGLAKYDLEIRFRDGLASLAGDVSSPAEAIQAQQLTATVPGVGQVRNDLTVQGKTARQMMAERAARMPQRPGQNGPIQQTSGLQAPPMPAQYGPAGGPVAPYGNGPQPASMTVPRGMMPQGVPNGMAPQGVRPTGHHVVNGAGPQGAPIAGSPVYNAANLPGHAWPTYAPYDNYAAVTYPSQYDASAFPYIGPFYPYPQVPMGWRSAQLDWDDGHWKLRFAPKTDKWWWFVNPANWH